MAGKFEPKVAVQLNPPKDDPISVEELAKADGEQLLTDPPKMAYTSCIFSMAKEGYQTPWLGEYIKTMTVSTDSGNQGRTERTAM